MFLFRNETAPVYGVPSFFRGLPKEILGGGGGGSLAGEGIKDNNLKDGRLIILSLHIYLPVSDLVKQRDYLIVMYFSEETCFIDQNRVTLTFVQVYLEEGDHYSQSILGTIQIRFHLSPTFVE